MQVISSLGQANVILGADNTLNNHGASLLSNGGYVFVWDEPSGVSKAQIFRANGTPKTEVFDLGDNATYENRPDVATLPDGSFVIAYTSVPSGGSGASISAQRFSANGSPIGDELTVYGNAAHNSFDPEITALADGGYVVAYNGSYRDGSYYSYHIRVFGADGTPRGNDFRVNQTTDSFQSFGDVTPLQDGNFAVTWRSGEVDGSFNSVMLRLFEEDGTPITSELQVNQYWQDSQIDPSIDTLNNGNIVVTWKSYGQDGSGDGVYARLIGPDGHFLADEFQVHTQVENAQSNPEVTALSDGGFVIVWVNSTSDETASILGQRFSSNGDRIGGEIELSEGSQQLNVRPIVDEVSAGVISVSWQDFDRDTFTGQIIEKLFLTPALGSSDNDTLLGSKFGDLLKGIQGDDILLGYAGHDTLKGGKGQDVLRGHLGADHLSGGGNRDELFGNRGKDILDGGMGNDLLKGGVGADTFLFRAKSGKDTILDFKNDVDTLQLDERLWGGGLNQKQMLETYAYRDGGSVVLDFGQHEIRINNFSDVNSLIDDIDFI